MNTFKKFWKEFNKQEEPKDWITVNGQHIPIKEGQSKKDAISSHFKDKENKPSSPKLHLTIANIKKTIDGINSGGITFDTIRGKDYAHTNNIAVAPFPERSLQIKGKIKAKQLVSWIKQNSDLLKNKGFCVGGWYSSDNGETYVDVSVPISDKKEKESVKLGQDSNQKALFHLGTFNEINTGGTGEVKGVKTSFEDRLKRAKELVKYGKK